MELWIYWLVLGMMGEYISFYGGIKEMVLVVMVILMNWINGFYECDFIIIMVLVVVIDIFIYFDFDIDFYINNDLGVVLGEN